MSSLSRRSQLIATIGVSSVAFALLWDSSGSRPVRTLAPEVTVAAAGHKAQSPPAVFDRPTTGITVTKAPARRTPATRKAGAGELRASQDRRRRTRSSFQGLKQPAASKVLRQTHSDFAADPAGNKPKLHATERITGFVSPTLAVVERQGEPGHAFVESLGEPLAVPVGSGADRQLLPIDLQLEKTDEHWTPARAEVDVKLPVSGTGNAIVGGALTIRVGGTDEQAELLADGTKAFYGNVDTDTDLVLEPANTGLMASWVLRSEQAPVRLTVDLLESDGQRPDLRLRNGGSAEVQYSKGLATISEPTAWDAEGRPVPATFELRGGELAVAVPHAGEDIAYPIMVDPIIKPIGWDHPAVLESRLDDFGMRGPANGPTGWQFSESPTEVFGRSHGYEDDLLIRAVADKGAGVATFSLDPQGDSSVFRVEFYGLQRDNANVCVTLGIQNASGGFGDGLSTAYWTAPSVPPAPPSGTGSGAFTNCGDDGPLARTHVQVCAQNNGCGWGGTPNNRVAFQVEAFANRDEHIDTRIEGVYVFHRELDAPVVGEISGVTSPPEWVHDVEDLSVAADDAGVGFCDDPEVYDDYGDNVEVQPSLQVTDRDAHGVLAEGNVAGCDGKITGEPGRPRVGVTWSAWRQLDEGVRTLVVKATDMLGNVGQRQHQVKIDHTAPRIELAGRLASYLTRTDYISASRSSEPWPNHVTDPWRDAQVSAPVRTIHGPADLVIGVKDSANHATSGVQQARAFIYRVDGDPDTRDTPVVELFDGDVSCTGQDGCDRPSERFAPDRFSSLEPGQYRLFLVVEDGAGNIERAAYDFAKGGAELTSVAEGQGTARWVPVEAKLLNNGTGSRANFQWRTGTRGWATVPAEALRSEATGAQKDCGDVTAADCSAGFVPVANGKTERYVLDLETLIAHARAADSDFKDLAGGQVFLRAEFPETNEVSWARTSEDVAIRLDRGGRDTSDDKIDLGPGSLDLMTGNLDIDATDVVLDGADSVTLERSYGSRYAGRTGVLGPGWSFGLPASEAASFVRAVDLNDPARGEWLEFTDPWSDRYDETVVPEERYAAVRIESADGSSFVFEHRKAGAEEQWVPEVGFANFSLTLLSSAGGPGHRYQLTDHATGVTTVFSRRLDNPATPPHNGLPEHGTYGVTAVQDAATTGKVSWTYTLPDESLALAPELRSALVPTRVVSSHDDQLDCTAQVLPRGCRALDFTYVKHAQSGGLRLAGVSVTATATTPGAPLHTEAVVAYEYGGAEGRLVRVVDAVADLATAYEYTSEGLVSRVTPAGEEAHELVYIPSDDPDERGRLKSAGRNGLSGAWKVRYGDARFGLSVGPVDLTLSATQKWGQDVTPFRAAAIFPPNVPESSDDTVPEATDRIALQKASLRFLDSLGRVLNVADPGAGITSVSYDKWGNVVRSLTASNREAALQSTNNTRQAADRLASHNRYEQDGRGGTRLVGEVGPEHGIRMADGTLVRGRSARMTAYDTGVSSSDPAFPYNLPTIELSGALTGGDASGTGGSLWDARMLQTTYHLPSRQVLTVRENVFSPDSKLVRTIRDAQGRELERRQPQHPGTAAAGSANVPSTTVTRYYETGDSPTPGCGHRPEWSGLVCLSGPAAQHEQKPLPTKRYEYDFWRRLAKTTESVPGRQTDRVTETQVDAQWRPLMEIVSGPGEPVQRVRHAYSPASGAAIRTEQLDSNGQVTRKIERSVDSYGRVTEYRDGSGYRRTTDYDNLSRPTTEMDFRPNGAWGGARSLQYDGGGRVTGLVDTSLSGGGAATITSYDVDGRPTAFAYPHGVTKHLEYDETGGLRRVRYVKATCVSNCIIYENSVTRSEHGQVVDDESTLGERHYRYDGLGRISSATDRPAGGACVTRSYTYDADSNRLSKRTATGASTSAACPSPGSGALAASSYDTADRLLATDTGSGTPEEVEYDTSGRITQLPAQASGSPALTSTYFANDLTATLEAEGEKLTNTIDGLGRAVVRTTTAGASDPITERYLFPDDTDSPSHIMRGSDWTRLVSDQFGDLVAIHRLTSTPLLQVTNVRGDVVGVAAAQSASSPFLPAASVDEFGVQAPEGPVGMFGFLGGKKRESLLNGAAVAMGVRTYAPQAGRFLQVDPVLGGSANPYDYANQDSCNQFDLDGRLPQQMKNFVDFNRRYKFIIDPVTRAINAVVDAGRRCAIATGAAPVLDGLKKGLVAAADGTLRRHSERYLRLGFFDSGRKGRLVRRQLSKEMGRAALKTIKTTLKKAGTRGGLIGIGVTCLAGIVRFP